MIAICYLLSAICYPLSAIRYLLSAIRYLLSAICYPLSAIRYLLSAIRYLLSAICYLLSAICTYPARRAVANGKRAARMAGNSPPINPISSAYSTPLMSSAGLTSNANVTWLNVCQLSVAAR